MKLYVLAKSLNSRKLLALVNHLDLPVEVIALSVEQVQRDADFAAINPNRLAPALLDDGFALWESNAIGMHLAHGSALAPQTAKGWADMTRWLLWEGIHYNRALGTIFFESVVRPQMGWGEPNQALVDDALVQAGKYMAVLDAHLADHRFVLGDTLSFADFAVASAEPYRGRMAVDFERFANLQRWYDGVAALPAWQKALGREALPVAA